MADEIYEIFGKKVRVIQDPHYPTFGYSFTCRANCALYDECCNNNKEICRDANDSTKRHFELVE